MNGYVLNFQLIKTQNCINNTVLLLHDLLLNHEMKKYFFADSSYIISEKQDKGAYHKDNYL